MLPVLKIELCGKSRQLCDLCVFERVLFGKKIRAGILPPGIKEGVKQLVSQIIMMGNVPASTRGRVQMSDPGKQVADTLCQTSCPVLLPGPGIRKQKRH